MNNEKEITPSEKEVKDKFNRHRYLEKNKISEKTRSSMKMRIVIGLLMCAVGVPCVVIGEWCFFSLVILVIGFATYEIVHAPTNRKFSLFVTLITYIVMFALVFWLTLKSYLQQLKIDPDHILDINTIFNTLWISPAALAVLFGAYFFVVVLKEDFDVGDACYLITMVILLALGFQSILYLRYAPFQQFEGNTDFAHIDVHGGWFKYLHSICLIIYVLLGTIVNDIGAYFVGILFGKNKINPRISPNKTYEGFIGGIFFSTIFSFSFAMILSAIGYPILPNLTVGNWYWILLISLIMPFVANLGDFTFSAIKRYFGIKDFSKIFGPHGGCLDRFDSLIFVSVAVTVAIIFINNNWNFLV